MSKSKEDNQSITFKSLVSLYQEFNKETELSYSQFNAMQHTMRLLNTWDRKGSCNYDQPYTLAEQGETEKNETTVTMALYEKVLNENETLKADLDDLQADLIKQANDDKITKLAKEMYGDKETEIEKTATPIAVKTTSKLNSHLITILDDNTVDVVATDVEHILQEGSLRFNEHLPNSTILEYCERNVV